MASMKEHFIRLQEKAIERDSLSLPIYDHALNNCGHTDGYDLADYMEDRDVWAARVLMIADSPRDGELFLAAVKDYNWHIENSGGRGTGPRGSYIASHVAGQIDRALEIVGHDNTTSTGVEAK